MLTPTRTRAPQLEGAGWLNTDRPLRFGAELQGHVVLLDFWTYCCINCMHVLDDLAWLERKYAGQPFVVIGVHSAKFENEATRENILAAVHRYRIAHPVLIDEQMRLWRAYAVRAWPTLVLVDPQGYIVGYVSGEGHREVLDGAIADLLRRHREAGTLAPVPLRIRRESRAPAPTGLAFPGKVLADLHTRRLIISDSGHHRIIVTTWPDATGRCEPTRVIGSGRPGRDDGPATHASFRDPQGLALLEDTLFVADTGNHLIRRIDLRTGNVSTFAGTGEISYDRHGGNTGTQQGLNSPWDLAIRDNTLYVAMAGLHQIWAFDLATARGEPVAGSGREDIIDGPAPRAALAQPSGLAVHGEQIFFADSEASAVRFLDLRSREVVTLVGRGLFIFGDVDGALPDARLQHPLGVAVWNNRVLVADTYNHKIRSIDLPAGPVGTLAGLGHAAPRGPDGQPGFYEPGGIAVAEDTLFVADTNHHRIVMLDLREPNSRWAQVRIENLTAPDEGKAPPPDNPGTPAAQPGAGKTDTRSGQHSPPAHAPAYEGRQRKNR